MITWKQKNEKASSLEDVFRERDLTEIIQYSSIPHMGKAAKRILDAAYNNENIFVCGDYDSDGITSSAILWHGINALLPGNSPLPITHIRLPRRFSEGYGLSKTMVEEIPFNKGILITIDNGIAAFESIAFAKEKGLEVIIIDHHLPDPKKGVPQADIIVDPHVYKNADTYENYCAAGLAYRLIKTMWEKSPAGMLSEDLDQRLLAFAAIGTIGDVVPLLQDNRKIVKEGLAVIRSGKNLPEGVLRLLAETNKTDAFGKSFLTETDIAFGIVPYINAYGRMMDDGAQKALEYLLSETVSENEISKFISVRDERKKRQEEDTKKVLEIVENGMKNDRILVVYSPDLHEGIIGIIASTLVEKYYRPAIVLTQAEKDGKVITKGSGRTYGDIHLKDMLDQVSSVFLGYGGHKGAAGMSLPPKNVDTLRNELQKIAPPIPDQIVDYYDIEIRGNEATEKLYEKLSVYGPFGEGNPKVRFLVKDLSLIPNGSGFFRHLGSNEENIKLFSKNANVLAFGLYSRYKEIGTPVWINVIANLDINAYMGEKTFQIEAIDFVTFPGEQKNAKSPLQALLEEKMKQKMTEAQV